MDYVLIKNGQIVCENEVVSKDLLIGNNKIITMGENISRPEPETPVIDAEGKFLLPGAIDTSATFAGISYIESDIQKRFNQAEVVGGITTVLETMLPVKTLNATSEVVNRRKKKLHIVPDFSFHLSLQGWDNFSAKDIDYCYSHEGITSYYLRWPMMESFNQTRFDEILEVIAFFDLLVVIEMQQPEAMSSGYVTYDIKNGNVITEHLRQLKFIVGRVVKAGCRVCILNMCFIEQLEIFNEFESTGLLSVELVFPFNIGGKDKYEANQNSIFSGFSLSNRLHLIPVDQLWDLLKRECFTLARPLLNLSGEGILKDSQVNNRPDEFFLMKNFLSAVYTAGVVENQISLVQLSSIISTRQSRLFGLYPKKGVLRIGADADIIVWDPNFERSLYCNYPVGLKGKSNSVKLKGRADFVFVRGHMVYDGEHFSEEGCCGRFLYRSPVL